MSKRALEVHWGVHHRDFVDNLNKRLGKSDILYGYTMDELVKATYNNGNPLPEFNNAAEVWNANCSSLNCLVVLDSHSYSNLIWLNEKTWVSAFIDEQILGTIGPRSLFQE